MIKRLNGLFQFTTIYDNPLARQRAAGLFGLTGLLVLGWAVWLALVAAPALLAGDAASRVLPGAGGALVLVAILALLQTGRLTTAAWLFVLLLVALSVPSALVVDIAATTSTLLSASPVLIPLVAAGLLLDRRGFSMVALLLIGAIAFRAYLENNALGSVSPDLLSLALVMAATTTLLLIFGGQVARSLEQLTHERRVLSVAAGYVELLKHARDEDDLLRQTAARIRDDMGYAGAQVYLVDGASIRRTLRPGLNTVTTSASEADRAVVAEVADSRAPVVSMVHNAHRQRLVAPIQAALTIPVMTGDALVAAIDIQTTQDSFSPGETDGLCQLAAQLGMHLAELRLVDDLRRTVREQEASLHAGPVVRSPNRRQTGPLTSTPFGVAGFDLDARGGRPTLTETTTFTDALRGAADLESARVETTPDGQRLLLPIRYRGATLGAMTLEIPADRPVGERGLALAQIVAERLGQALDNARLFEQSQAQAQREHKASEVANALISATDVRAVLALAAESFNEAMGAVATRVTLQPDTPDTNRVEREGVAP